MLGKRGTWHWVDQSPWSRTVKQPHTAISLVWVRYGFKNPKCSSSHKIGIHSSPIWKCGIRWTRACRRPQWSRAQLTLSPCTAVRSFRSQVTSWSMMAAPALPVVFTLQSERRKKSEDKGILSSYKDASQKWHASFLLTSHRLEFCHLTKPASIGWKNIVGPKYKMGVSVIIEGGGIDTFGYNQQFLSHSLSSVALNTLIFTLPH